ncbi:MAG: hypothetical protein RLZ74_769 [Actinomycetota bacterium]
MNVDLGTIPESELQLVAAMIRVATVEEDRGSGVIVRSENGIRTWEVGDDELWTTVHGEAHHFEGTYNLPGRIVLGASEFAENGTSCELVVRDRMAIAQASNGTTLQLAIASKTPQVRTSDEFHPVSAEISLRDLQRAFSVATEFPLDVEDFMEIYSKPPTGHFEVSKNQITIRRSWAYVGGLDTVVTIPARTKGTGTFYAKYYALNNLLSRTFFAGDPMVSLSFDPVGGRYMDVRVDSLCAHLERHPEGAAQFYPQVVSWLKENSVTYVQDSSGVIAANYEDTAVRLQLFDGTDPVLRATVTVLHGVKESAKLLRELNRLNTTRVGIRIWHDNNMIVVGFDEKCEGTTNLKSMLANVTREARHLGGLLGPMYGGTPPAKAA